MIVVDVFQNEDSILIAVTIEIDKGKTFDEVTGRIIQQHQGQRVVYCGKFNKGIKAEIRKGINTSAQSIIGFKGIPNF